MSLSRPPSRNRRIVLAVSGSAPYLRFTAGQPPLPARPSRGSGRGQPARPTARHGAGRTAAAERAAALADAAGSGMPGSPPASDVPTAGKSGAAICSLGQRGPCPTPRPARRRWHRAADGLRLQPAGMPIGAVSTAFLPRCLAMYSGVSAAAMTACQLLAGPQATPKLAVTRSSGATDVQS